MKILDRLPKPLKRRLRSYVARSVLPSSADLIAELKAARDNGVIQREEYAIVERVLRASELKVRDVMIPRAKMVTIDHESTLEEILRCVTESGHSRFPVINENAENEIRGILLAKDILHHHSDNGHQEFSLFDSIRDPMFVAESMRLHSLLKRFQERRSHMAIVVNEYKGIAGLITIEDVLEQMVGDIEDESDIETDEMITEPANNLFSVNAQTEIEEFNERFDAEFPDDVDTIGGVILKLAGRVPVTGDQFDYRGFKFEVTEADSRRILQLQVTPLRPLPPDSVQ
ncbi:MAG: CBS domain-containing protein [Gammaproteobacteria bacterium]|nr:CBS domain-containing protein [Gammaproteobacteria bacterium]MYD78140.1 CBS domain-containing protein [Gammaproteobacteria bacterium]MYI90197.1 CBS domain-containing protein [Gammaproteobacteria bacterium]